MQTTEVITKIKWAIDPLNSQIGFRVKHLMFTNVRGSFKEFDASIYTTGEDFTTAEIDLWINPASIDTGNEKRDEHLKSTDFFEVEKFREINFMADSLLEVDNDGNYELYGALTLKGISRQIKLNLEFGGLRKDPWGTDRALFTINGKINRKDWGLNWNAALETGGVLVSEDVWIICELQLIRQSDFQDDKVY
jgi:polyisoprenoid-binding protein YceI